MTTINEVGDAEERRCRTSRLIDWEKLPCRHAPRCSDCATGIYYVPEGCNCFSDPVQALCEQHFIKVHSTGPIMTIVRAETQGA